ncbi:MAG TPA: Hint domain-containing protein [Acetobacteraceae bacterium]|nr:Hint domain-containing protein [Acetobacteraceae bacterium]
MSDTTVSSGVISSGLLLGDGDTLQVQFGGTAIDTVVSSGGFAGIYGAAIGTIVGPGGGQNISSGGTAVSATISGLDAYQFLYQGAASGTAVRDGGEEGVRAGGVATGTTLAGSSALQVVSSGGTASATVVNGGAENAANEQLVKQGGLAIATELVGVSAYQFISSGGTASLTTASLGAGIGVRDGGNIVSATVNSGSYLNASSGGIATDTEVASGGFVGALTGGYAIGTAIDSGGLEHVSSGGTAIATRVSGGGTMRVLSGGMASGTRVDSGGVQYVFSGGTASATAVSGGGLAQVYSGGVLTGVTLASGGIIDLQDVVFASSGMASLDSGSDILTVTEGGTSVQLQLSGDYGGMVFHAYADTDSSTRLIVDGVACYRRGTRVLTERGEVAVEALAIGDLLITHFLPDGRAVLPLRWIGRRGYGGRFAAANRDVLPVCIHEGALAENVPRRALWVSPQHALYLDGVLVPAAALVNGISIVRAEAVEQVEYFHLELERHAVILAEGAPAESFVDDDSRGMFQNAAEYRALYPDAPSGPAVYCAPRVEQGEALEALRARLAARAGLYAGAGPAPGRLIGNLERADRALVAGWACDEAAPGRAVRLRVLAGGVLLGEVLANRFRGDLLRAGIGDGRHGFSFAIPDGLAPLARHSIEVRRAGDGQALPGAPRVVEAAGQAVA